MRSALRSSSPTTTPPTTSLLFSPAPSAFVGERFPALLERTDTTPPLM